MKVGVGSRTLKTGGLGFTYRIFFGAFITWRVGVFTIEFIISARALGICIVS